MDIVSIEAIPPMQIADEKVRTVPSPTSANPSGPFPHPGGSIARPGPTHSRATSSDPQPIPVSKAFEPLAIVAPILLLLFGTAVLIGWQTGNETLMRVLPGYVRMSPNAALGFIAAGLGLAGTLDGSALARRITQGFGTLTIACGALTLMEVFAPLKLHIDHILYRDLSLQLAPGRMAHLTAVNFCLAGLALVLLHGRPVAARVAQSCALLLIADSFAACVGYLYGAPLFLGSFDSNIMALESSVGFLVLGVGLVMAQRETGIGRIFSARQLGGQISRWLQPVVLLLPLIPGWIYLHPDVLVVRLRLAMTLFACAFVGLGSVALWSLAVYLNRKELARLKLIRACEESALEAQQSERELRLVTDHLPTLLSYIDMTGRFLRVNRTYERWTGLPASEIVGHSILEMLGQDYWDRTTSARDAVLRGETVTFEIAYPTVFGLRQTEVTYAPDKDDAGQVRGIACMVLDINEKHRAELALIQSAQLESANRQLHQLAITDQLTGLKNRRGFEDQLAIECVATARDRTCLSVLMIDIDNFKARNDTWGHAAGDEVLRKLGAILAATIAAPSLPARYGGEEFTILLPGTDHAHAYLIAERLQHIIADQPWGDLPVTLSIGISCSTTVGVDAIQLVHSADQALYLAKRTGKNRICTETVV